MRRLSRLLPPSAITCVVTCVMACSHPPPRATGPHAGHPGHAADGDGDGADDDDDEKPVTVSINQPRYGTAHARPAGGPVDAGDPDHPDPSASPAPSPRGRPAGVKRNGNGAKAYRDAGHHVHGPGGPIFMGRGPRCDAARDHCLRPDIWFQADDVVGGKLYRALPVFELDGAWYPFNTDTAKDGGTYLRTEVAEPGALRHGDRVVVFTPAPPSPRFTDTEYDALTSSRWEAALVDHVDVAAGTMRVQGWDEDFPLDTVRIVVEER